MTDTRVSLQQSTSGLSDVIVASETNHDSVVRITNDYVELTGEQSYSADCESNPESSDVL